jgi:hypothetical protein
LQRLLAVSPALFLTACGYVGSPLTPLANVPTKISDLAAVQRGGTLIVHCTVPTMTTENFLIKTPLQFDLRVGPGGANFQAAEWAGKAKQFSHPEVQDGLATFQIPSAEWTGKEVAIGVRAIGPNGKESEWSNFQIVPVVAAPETPSQVEVQDTAAGERVTWSGHGDRFRIERRSGATGPYAAMATVEGHEWVDNTIEYGKPYSYLVQALVNAGDRKVAESEPSAPQSRTPQDKFPPAVPAGLRADLAPNSASLVWEPDSDADLAGYRVYRSTDGGAWEKLADVSAIPTYSDTTIEHGKHYRYAVSAFDKVGNESERCAPVEIAP